MKVHPSMRCPACSSLNVAVRDHDGHGAAIHVNPSNNGRWSSRCTDCGHRWNGNYGAERETVCVLLLIAHNPPT